MSVARYVILLIGILSVLTGMFIFSAPKTFYQAVPGLSSMGPFSVHFIGDVGLAYMSGGAVLVAASLLADRRLGVAGALWFSLHGLFHLHIWAHRGFPFDQVFWFDVLAVVLPAIAALWAAMKLVDTRRS